MPPTLYILTDDLHVDHADHFMYAKLCFHREAGSLPQHLLLLVCVPLSAFSGVVCYSSQTLKQRIMQARIQGFGSSSSNADAGPSAASSTAGPSAASTAGNANWGASGGTSTSASSSSKMVGFGNPRFEASKVPPARGGAQGMAQNVLNSKNWATAASSAANAASTLASKGQAAVLNFKGIQSLMKDEVSLCWYEWLCSLHG